MIKVFTTGQVAKICKVSPRTVSKWFDSGRLRGYRLPVSRNRRIPRQALVRFLNEHGMPLTGLENDYEKKIVLVGLSAGLCSLVTEQLPAKEGFVIEVAQFAFEAAAFVESIQADCLVIDLCIGHKEAVQLCQKLRQKPDQSTIIIGLVNGGASFDHHLTELREGGFTEVFREPVDVAVLVERIRRMIDAKKAAEA